MAINAMKIGYPCLNLTINCKGNQTFRLKSYSEERLISAVDNNLACLGQMLKFNVAHDILFFRISSDLVPFASHPICQFDWQDYFEARLNELGYFIYEKDIRISMHPDQFTIINSPNDSVFERSVKELVYHAQLLDSMYLDITAKIQIHVGGVYGDKVKSMQRFTRRFLELPEIVRRRLVVENDDRLYTLKDCIEINSSTGIPVLFDVFHHEINSSGETVKEVLKAVRKMWKPGDGIPMVDYSYQRTGDRKGKHTESINTEHFGMFLKDTYPHDYDIMLELKDKELSAIKAVNIARADDRFHILSH